MIPFAYFSIIDIFLLSSYYYENSFFEYFLEVLRYGWGGIALWFVPVLFVAELLFFFFSKLPSIILKIVSITLVSIIGSLLCKYHMILPWSMSTIFIGSAFVCMGNLLKEKISVLLCNSKILSILCIACFSIGLLISHFWRLDLFSNQINPLIPLLIGALSGILFIIIISNWIANKYTKLSSLFTYFGKNSFIIMAFSQSFMMCIIHFFRNTFTEFPLLSSSIRHCCLWILMVIAIELINKKMPWIMGRH